MTRKRSTDVAGKHFTDAIVGATWQKAQPIPQYDASLWRRDVCGNAIKFTDYGNSNSEYGWEVDHIKPVEKYGTDHPDNLQPLQWRANRDKAATHPWVRP